jgi:hypothetical protein
MSVFVKLSALAIRPILGAVARTVLPGIGGDAAEKAGAAVERYFVSRFTEPSQRLRKALRESNERSWRAVELALAPETMWGNITSRLFDKDGDDKGFRDNLRAFLEANPLQLPPEQADEVRKRALRELHSARRTKIIPGSDTTAGAMAKEAACFYQFRDAPAIRSAELEVISGVACQLRESGYPTLAKVIEARPVADGPHLITFAVRYFFRHEVEDDEQLFQGLVYEQVDQIGKAVTEGFDKLLDSLRTHEDRLVAVLTLAEAIHADVLDLKEEQRNMGDNLRGMYAQVEEIGRNVNRLLERNISAGDSCSIRSEAERELVRALKAKYRSLPDDQRARLPALLLDPASVTYP